MANHTIQTTMRPDQTITVGDAEYQQLLAEGLVYSGSPVTPTADSYDLLFADKVQHGTATPAALRAAYVPFWAPAEAVTAGAVRVDSTGHLITRNANGTTRSTYDATEQAAWTVVSGGGGGSAGAAVLVPTATKTAAYTAAVGDLAMMNVAGGATTLTLPTAPADKAQVGFVAIGATTGTPLTVNRGGTTDVLGTSAATTLTVPLSGEVTVYQYQAASARWLPVANVKPLTALDGRYDAAGAAAGAAAASYPLAEPGALITSPSPDGVSQSGLWTPRTAPMVPPSKVISRFQSGHGWTGGTDDTTVKLFTDRSYRQASNGTGGTAYFTGPTITGVDVSNSIVRVIFRVDNAARISGAGLNMFTSSGNLFQANLQFTALSNEWIVATVNRSQATSIGSPSWSSITQWSVFFNDAGAGAVTMYLAAVELIPDRAATYPNGVFIMEADDGFAGQKSYLAPVVGQRGIPVTYNVIAQAFLGATNNSGMTASDLRTFQDKHGWSVSCHGFLGASHDGPSTAAQMETDFQRQKHWLRANGLHSGTDHYALCPGTGSPVAEGAMMDAIRRNFRSARVNSGAYETANPADPLRLRSILFTGNTVAQLQTNITAVAGAGGALIFTVHDVIAGATNGTSFGLPAIAQANLATILDFAAGKGMVFRTRADFIEGK